MVEFVIGIVVGLVLSSFVTIARDRQEIRRKLNEGYRLVGWVKGKS